MKYFLFLVAALCLASCGQTPAVEKTPEVATEQAASAAISSGSGDSAPTSESSFSGMSTGGLGAPELPAIESSDDLGYTGIFSFTGGNMQVIERRKGTVGSLTVKVLTDTNDLWTGEEVTTAPVTSSAMTDLDRDGREEVLVFLQSASGGFTHASVVGYERNVPDWKRFTSDALKPLYSEGMRWNDAFEIHQWRLFQRFPYFRESDSDDSPNGGEKVIEYRLVESSSGRTLRAVDFMRRSEYGEALWALQQVGTHEFVVNNDSSLRPLSANEALTGNITNCAYEIVRYTLKSDLSATSSEGCFSDLRSPNAPKESLTWEYDFMKKRITFKNSEGNLTGIGFSVDENGAWTQVSTFTAL